MSYPTPQLKEWRQNPAYRFALTLFTGRERVMAKQKTVTCRKCKGGKCAQPDVIADGYDAGKDFGISEDASRSAWEQKYVREIMSRMRMF
jgi:hypothetical protein